MNWSQLAREERQKTMKNVVLAKRIGCELIAGLILISIVFFVGEILNPQGNESYREAMEMRSSIKVTEFESYPVNRERR